jgi:hypothetical protein
MIKEEQFICHKHNPSIFNQKLTDKLKVLKSECEQLFSEILPGKENDILSNIYKLIMLVNEIPMVKKQIDAIKTYQQSFISSNEQDASRQVTNF